MLIQFWFGLWKCDWRNSTAVVTTVLAIFIPLHCILRLSYHNIRQLASIIGILFVFGRWYQQQSQDRKQSNRYVAVSILLCSWHKLYLQQHFVIHFCGKMDSTRTKVLPKNNKYHALCTRTLQSLFGVPHNAQGNWTEYSRKKSDSSVSISILERQHGCKRVGTLQRCCAEVFTWYLWLWKQKIKLKAIEVDSRCYRKDHSKSK